MLGTSKSRLTGWLRCGCSYSPRLTTGTRTDYGGRLTPIVVLVALIVLGLVTSLGMTCHSSGLSSSVVTYVLSGIVLTIVGLVQALTQEGWLLSTVHSRAGGQSIMAWLIIFEVSFFVGALWCYGLSRVNTDCNVTLGHTYTCGLLAGERSEPAMCLSGQLKLGIGLWVPTHPLTDLRGVTPTWTNSATQAMSQTAPFTGVLCGTGIALLVLLLVSLVLHWSHRSTSLENSKVHQTLATDSWYLVNRT